MDILALNETKMDANTTDSEIEISGYTLFRLDRNSFGGSVAIYMSVRVYKLKS